MLGKSKKMRALAKTCPERPYVQAIQNFRARAHKKAAAVLVSTLVLAGMATGLLAGCSDTRIVLTAGLKKEEVFRIGEISCMLPEAMVYLTNLQNQYEAIYGDGIWEAAEGDVSLEEQAKEQVLAELSQVKVMNLLAKEKGTVLEEREMERVSAASRDYFASLSEAEKKALDVSEKLITQMYQEYALAQKVYDQIIASVNPEISDDEARTITVLAIHTEDRAKAQEAWEKAGEENADFEALAALYSQDSMISYSFGKGEIDPVIEEAAFNLGKNEVSPVIEATDGYYVLKCISTFDEAQTVANKEKLADERRKEAFNQEYNSFVETLDRQLNEELWKTVAMIRDENVKTDQFFTIYDTYFDVQ